MKYFLFILLLTFSIDIYSFEIKNEDTLKLTILDSSYGSFRDGFLQGKPDIGISIQNADFNFENKNSSRFFSSPPLNEYQASFFPFGSYLVTDSNYKEFKPYYLQIAKIKKDKIVNRKLASGISLSNILIGFELFELDNQACFFYLCTISKTLNRSNYIPTLGELKFVGSKIIKIINTTTNLFIKFKIEYINAN